MVGSAALLAVTGGMAAPAIVAGLSTAGSAVGLAGMASIGGAGSTAVLAAVFGTTGAGLVGYKLNRRLAGITDFSFVPVAAANAMSVTLVVSGYRPPARPPARPPYWLSTPSGIIPCPPPPPGTHTRCTHGTDGWSGTGGCATSGISTYRGASSRPIKRCDRSAWVRRTNGYSLRAGAANQDCE